MVPSLSQPLPAQSLLSLFPVFQTSCGVVKSDLFQKIYLGLVTLSGGCGLTRRSGAAKVRGGKPIIKIRKLKLFLMLRRLRRENAVQRMPPRAHLPLPDYSI